MEPSKHDHSDWLATGWEAFSEFSGEYEQAKKAYSRFRHFNERQFRQGWLAAREDAIAELVKDKKNHDGAGH